MAAFFQHQDFYWASRLTLDRFDLRHRAVLVVFTLDYQSGAGDMGKVLLDVPAAEVGVKPDMVPSPEGARGVAVVATQFLAKVSRFEFFFGFCNAGDTEVLHEDVRSQQNEAADVLLCLLRGSGVDDGDRSPVAVADQDRVADLELCEKIGKNLKGFFVHIGDGARLSEEIGITRTVAGVDGDRRSSGTGDFAGKLLPVRDGAEPLVEKDEFGSVQVAGRNAVDFKVVAVDFESLNVGMRHRLVSMVQDER